MTEPAPARPCRWRGLAPCLLLGVLLCLWLDGRPAGAQELPPPWRGAETLADLADGKRPAVLFLATPWCQFCKKMKRGVLVEPDALARLERDFVAIHLDLTEHPEAQERFAVRRVPTLLLLDPQGQTVLRLEGLVGTETLARALAFVAGGHYRQGDFASFQP